MLAILIGDLSLVVGFAVILLPLLLTELSRPKDAALGAVFLLVGLVLMTSGDRFRGSPMIALVSGTLLIGRLGWEVALSRWHQLSQEEKSRLGSWERWSTSFGQLSAMISNLGSGLGELIKVFNSRPKPTVKEKKWVRPEAEIQDQESLEGSQFAPKDVLEETKGATSKRIEVKPIQKGSSQDS